MSAPRSVEILAPAKVNLFLEALGRRADGYHEIVTVMQAVSLCDSITLSDSPGGISLACDDPRLPTDGRNLAVRAAELMLGETRAEAGVRIGLSKAIPVEAGLGGGSSDAAAVLLGLNRLWDMGLSDDRLAELAAGLGSDVAFFIRGGTALCTGRGEKVQIVRHPNVLHYVLAVPDFGAETGKVYKALKLPLTENVKNVKVLIERLRAGATPVRDIGPLLFNRLEEPACGLYPDLVSLKEKLLGLGCEAALVSGSGSCVYGIARGREEAREVAERLEGQGSLSAVRAVESLGPCFAARGMRVSR